jgi:hydroxymethylpyrimidine pyrophosphatase-like HAD family hydrolase
MAEALLVCTDLDRTLLPNGPQAESPGARERFARLVAQPWVTLAYVSGRHRALVEQAICDYHLPLPDFVVHLPGRRHTGLDPHGRPGAGIRQ